MAKFVNVGFGNIVNADKIVAIVSPDAAPIKRMVQLAKEEGRSIDATQGRKTKSVLVSEDNYIILSAIQPDTIGKRLRLEYTVQETLPETIRDTFASDDDVEFDIPESN